MSEPSLARTRALPGGVTRHQAIAWRTAIFVFFALCGVTVGSWMSRIPAVAEALGASTGELGFLVFLLSAASLAGLLFAPQLISRLGSRTTLAVSFSVIALGLAVSGIGVTAFASYELTVVGMLVYGLGLGVGDVAMNLSGAINERVLGVTVMPLFHAFFSIGMMAGAGIGALGELAGLTIAAQSIGIALVMTVAAIVASRFIGSERALDDETRPPSDPGWRDRARLFLDPRVLLIGVVVIGMAFAEGAASDWLSLAMVEGHGFSKADGALLLSLFVLAMTVARLCGGWVIDRFGRVRTLQVSALLAAVGLSLVIFVSIPWIAIGGIVLWGLGSALGYPTGISAAADDPRGAAARVATVAMIGWGAYLIGPPVIGFLGEQFGLLAALIPILGLILVAGLASPATRQPSALPSSRPERK